MELEAIIRNVPFQWFGLQSELNALTLKTLQGEKTIKSLFCGRRFDCYHTTVVLQRARPSCGSDDQVKIAISSMAGDVKKGVLNSYPYRFLTTRHFRNAKETGTS